MPNIIIIISHVAATYMYVWRWWTKLDIVIIADWLWEVPTWAPICVQHCMRDGDPIPHPLAGGCGIGSPSANMHICYSRDLRSTNSSCIYGVYKYNTLFIAVFVRVHAFLLLHLLFLFYKANSAFHPHGVDKWVVSFSSWCYNCSFSRGASGELYG